VIARALLLALLAATAACAASSDARKAPPGPLPASTDPAQVPRWSHGDLDFFLHGSMGAEVIPEWVLRAFVAAYPDLFPRADTLDSGAGLR
jgi:hypothetical protein